MTLHLQNLEPTIEAALRHRAALTGKTLEQVAIELMQSALATSGLDEQLQSVIGTWVEDPDFDDAIAEFEYIDPKAWQ